jgi:hypothetical protein
LPAIRYDLIVEQGADYQVTSPSSATRGSLPRRLDRHRADPRRLHLVPVDGAAHPRPDPDGHGVVLRVPAATSSPPGTFSLGRYDVELTAPDGTVTTSARRGLRRGPPRDHPRVGAGNSTELADDPRLTASIASQTDLPASFTAAALAVSGTRFYAALLP